jgi:hypothetical protein
MKLLTISILCGVLAACGGDDDGSGVDPDKPFGDATVEDAQAFCEYLDGLVSPEASQKVECYVEGILGAQQGRGDCQMIADDCLAEPIEEEPNECNEIDEADLAELPECASQVTFGEYEACVDAYASLNLDVAAAISCETDLEELFSQELPDACMQIQEDCPELIGNDG